MSQGVILGLAVVAGLACPLHMWWSHRRGRTTACGMPHVSGNDDPELEALRTRQIRLSSMISRHHADADGESVARPPETARN
ncbi:MAG: hypothetical protein ACYC91_18640 [Solirubrobacteraceae bacterium]